MYLLHGLILSLDYFFLLFAEFFLCAQFLIACSLATNLKWNEFALFFCLGLIQIITVFILFIGLDCMLILQFKKFKPLKLVNKVPKSNFQYVENFKHLIYLVV
jgi:hypothetical protein